MGFTVVDSSMPAKVSRFEEENLFSFGDHGCVVGRLRWKNGARDGYMWKMRTPASFIDFRFKLSIAVKQEGSQNFGTNIGVFFFHA